MKKAHRNKDDDFHLRHHYTRLISTPDEWFMPIVTAEGMFVTGTVSLEKKHPGGWVRISFWGDDDIGQEQESYFKTLDEALECYHKNVKWMSKLTSVSWKTLKSMGFVNA